MAEDFEEITRPYDFSNLVELSRDYKDSHEPTEYEARLVIDIDLDTLRRLNEEATRAGRPPAELVRRLVTAHLDLNDRLPNSTRF